MVTAQNLYGLQNCKKPVKNLKQMFLTIRLPKEYKTCETRFLYQTDKFRIFHYSLHACVMREFTIEKFTLVVYFMQAARRSKVNAIVQFIELSAVGKRNTISLG